MAKSNKHTIELTLEYYEKLTKREDYLENLKEYYEREVEKSSGGEYERVCKIAIANILPEFNQIQQMKQALTYSKLNIKL